MHIRYSVCALCACLSLQGCGSLSRSTYVPASIPLPLQYERASGQATAPLPGEAWWQRMSDPQLEAWIALAAMRNPDLAIAAVRVRRAALASKLAAQALWPTPSATLSGNRSQPLHGSAAAQTSVASQTGLAWELDLFGRLGAQQDAARLEAQASREDRDAVALSMVGSVANLYWQIAFANMRIASAQESLAYAQRVRDLVDLRHRAGAVSRLELREAEQAVAQQELAHSQLQQTRVELRQALHQLFDGEPPAVASEPQRLPVGALPPVTAGLPAELLGRRPDLRAAELRLRASLAAADAEAARIYPTLSLTGSLGTSSQALLDILANPAAALGATLSLPFLNARNIRLGADMARNRHEEAELSFRKAMYSALAEVEKALSARDQLMQQQRWSHLARDEAQKIEQLYAMRYRAGQVTLRDWLDAQERLRASELAYASGRLALLQSHLTLHQALGDGLPAMLTDTAGAVS